MFAELAIQLKNNEKCQHQTGNTYIIILCFCATFSIGVD